MRRRVRVRGVSGRGRSRLGGWRSWRWGRSSWELKIARRKGRIDGLGDVRTSCKHPSYAIVAKQERLQFAASEAGLDAAVDVTDAMPQAPRHASQKSWRAGRRADRNIFSPAPSPRVLKLQVHQQKSCYSSDFRFPNFSPFSTSSHVQYGLNPENQRSTEDNRETSKRHTNSLFPMQSCVFGVLLLSIP